MHYFNWNIGDYQSHTGHLEPLEDLAYRRMLEWQYLHEKPLPDDVDMIAKLVRMRSHCECIKNVLLEFFTCTEEGYFNDRVMDEINAFYSKKEKARASAKARWDKVSSKRNASGMRSHKKRNANQEPITINISFENFWSVYPNKKGKTDAEKKWPKLTDDDRQSAYDDCQVRYAETEKQFIPHGSTYLNKKPWHDDLTATKNTDRFAGFR